jgi:hypothetical protein
MVSIRFGFREPLECRYTDRPGRVAGPCSGLALVRPTDWKRIYFLFEAVSLSEGCFNSTLSDEPLSLNNAIDYVKRPRTPTFAARKWPWSKK